MALLTKARKLDFSTFVNTAIVNYIAFGVRHEGASLIIKTNKIAKR